MSETTHTAAGVTEMPAVLREVNPVPLERAVLVGHARSFNWITEKICGIIEEKTPRWWWICFCVAGFIASFTVMGLVYQVSAGVGVWGLANPINWGWAIVNFVFWIGIGHAGTLISAILLLMRQNWRTSINRFAEAMTLFAVANAGLFPLLHLGRPWFFYYILPYPNTMELWPQFRSPLVWDVFALTTYGLVSALFWYVGLIPDMATLRDRTTRAFSRIAYGMLAMGWRGSAMHWHRYQTAYFLLAALATPLVVSVHSIVGLDFAFSVIPGWHSTILPPYFVAGAVFSGFAMVMNIAIPLRYFYKLEGFITQRHLDNMAKVMLAMGLVVAYGYLLENFTAWYSGHDAEMYAYANRFTGIYAPASWALMTLNVVIPQALWFRRVRQNIPALFIISILINIGMWLERFIIVVTSLHRDYLPASWGVYVPTFWDWSTFLGTLGLFFALLFLFVRILPVISIFEMRELVHEQEDEEE